jgi:hypothetical protein
MAGNGTSGDPFVIEGWEIDASSADGIDIRNTDAYLIIRNNYIHSGGVLHDGIHLLNVSNCIIENCNTSGNFCLYIGQSDNISIRGNSITEFNYGIAVYISENISIENNDILSALSSGVWGYESQNVTIVNNRISNTDCSIELTRSRDVCTYHNTFTNYRLGAIDDQGAVNEWDAGYPKGGNYWDDYIGADSKNGPSQDISGSDGIGDVPYIIDFNSHDTYPLVNPFPSSNNLPVATFTVDPSFGNVSTHFTLNASEVSDSEDISSTLQVRWDFDGDGTWDTFWSKIKTVEHQFTIPNLYDAQLEVIDSSGQSSIVKKGIAVSDGSVDVVAPMTNCTIKGTKGLHDWYTSDLIISLSAADNYGGSCVNRTLYRINDEIWKEYASDFVVYSSGNTTIGFCSIDFSGNNESVNSIVVRIDKSEPVLSLITRNNSVFNPDNVTVVWEGYDNVSGLDHYGVRIEKSNFTILDNDTKSFNLTNLSIGTYNVTIQAVDTAGNKGEQTIQLRVEVPTESGSTIDILGWLFVIVPIIAIVLISYFIINHRKKKSDSDKSTIESGKEPEKDTK